MKIDMCVYTIVLHSLRSATMSMRNPGRIKDLGNPTYIREYVVDQDILIVG